MGVSYQAVLWNRQKKRYDRWMLILIALYLGAFIGFQFAFQPNITPETLIIRASGTLALLMLHFILLIGPLCRLNDRFLPLLYNRRHLGVTMFLFALIHGAFSIFQFHALGNVNPILSIFISNPEYASLANFPFQALGFFALLILFLMASSSHDFWLHNLSPRFWKVMHMMVYVAYGLIVMHVMLGAAQREDSPEWLGIMLVGLLLISVMHLAAAITQRRQQVHSKFKGKDGYFLVGELDEIPENRAKVVFVEGENIAVFKYDGKVSAINNVCKHQLGPLGEGMVVDGCVTCPWHGYQYRPEDGCSPPPFKEKVATYYTKIVGTRVYVSPQAQPEGTYVKPAQIPQEAQS
jgi:nitrite reductase/ring-hydroxylating ferredoxin subunit/DMSO/TMAO reductase YedYZ heme-binding membrane subunit